MATVNSFEFGKIFKLTLSIVPQNIFAPFIEGNVLQIVIWALLMGICVTIFGNRVAEFKEWILNLKQIIFKMSYIIFKVIPLIIFLCIFKTILIGSLDEILNVWRIIAAEYILFILTTVIFILRIAIKYDVKILDFLKRLSPVYLIAFTTSGGNATIPINLEVCKKNLNLDENICDFYLPLSYALCSTTLIIGIVACTFFAAYFSHVEISVGQLIIIAFLTVQFSISGVEGNGGMIAIMSLLLTQMNFSLDVIGSITIADIFTVNFAIVAALIIRDCDLFDVSHKIKFPEQK